MMFFGLFWLIVLLVVVRWMIPPDASRRLPPGRLQEMDAEMARMREEMDRLNGQVERLLDEQTFLLRLMEGDESRRSLRAPRESPEPGPEAPRPERPRDR